MADDLLDLPPQTRPAPGRRTSPNFVGHRARLLAASVCIAFALYTAAVPVGRAFLRMQVSYTEGWNVYNAAVVAHHGTLYPASYGWTSVNYPALSFYIVAGLGHFSHDFLFTARAISLLSTALCGLLVGLIVWRLTRARWPAFLAGLYCFTLFCASAEGYVGMDDPQMFAQVFLMAGLFVYVCYRGRLGGMIVAALLLTIGANIKHNLIEFPLAVLLDLLFVSRRKAIQFAIVGGALAALSIVLNIRFGGPGFLREMLAPRDYSLDHLVSNLADAYKPIVVPALLALAMAFRYSKHAERRIVSFLFAASVLTALAFGGGSGVWINVFFGGMLSVAMLLGLFLGDLQSVPKCPPWLSTAAPLFLFVWLIIPLVYSGNWRPLPHWPRRVPLSGDFNKRPRFSRHSPAPRSAKACCAVITRKNPTCTIRLTQPASFTSAGSTPVLSPDSYKSRNSARCNSISPSNTSIAMGPGTSVLSLQSFTLSSNTTCPSSKMKMA